MSIRYFANCPCEVDFVISRNLEHLTGNAVRACFGLMIHEGADDPACDHEHAPAPKLHLSESGVVERAAALFRAVGDPARLRMLERLSFGECCVSELAAETGDGMSTVSQRLKLLRAERLVSRRRDGKHIYYALADAHVAELIKSALAHAAEKA